MGRSGRRGWPQVPLAKSPTKAGPGSSRLSVGRPPGDGRGQAGVRPGCRALRAAKSILKGSSSGLCCPPPSPGSPRGAQRQAGEGLRSLGASWHLSSNLILHLSDAPTTDPPTTSRIPDPRCLRQRRRVWLEKGKRGKPQGTGTGMGEGVFLDWCEEGWSPHAHPGSLPRRTLLRLTPALQKLFAFSEGLVSDWTQNSSVWERLWGCHGGNNLHLTPES